MAEEKEEHRIVSFRNQRVGWTFVIFTIVFIATSAVLWNHVDSFFPEGTYRVMAKLGLLLLPAVTLMMTIFELFADDTGAARVHKSHPLVVRFVNFCFWGSILLAVCEVIHAGAVLKYGSSTTEQKATIAAIGDGQAKIAGAATSAAIESSGKVAERLNSQGQTRSASRTIQTGKDVAKGATQTAQESFQKAASELHPSTFLPEWYMNGGMYAALPVLALLAFALTMFFARKAQPYIDKDDDGDPDYRQKPKQTAAMSPAPTMATTTAKTPGNSSTTFSTGGSPDNPNF